MRLWVSRRVVCRRVIIAVPSPLMWVIIMLWSVLDVIVHSSHVRWSMGGTGVILCWSCILCGVFVVVIRSVFCWSCTMCCGIQSGETVSDCVACWCGVYFCVVVFRDIQFSGCNEHLLYGSRFSWIARTASVPCSQLFFYHYTNPTMNSFLQGIHFNRTKTNHLP